MSIATQLQALENNITDAYNMVSQRGGTVPARKNTENLDDAIATIPSLGSVLWASSAVNPTLVGTYTLDINLHDDTSYPSVTPSTTAQNVLGSAQSALQTTGPQINLADKSYMIIEDIIVPHVYTSTPSGIAYTNCLAHKGVYLVGRRFNGAATLTTPGYALFLTTCSCTVNGYYTSGGVLSTAASSYGVYSGIVAPTISSSSSDTPTLYFPNPAVNIRTSSTYMAAGAWSLLDDTETYVKVRWQVFSIDKPSMVETVATINRNAAATGTFQNNLIMLGGNV